MGSVSGQYIKRGGDYLLSILRNEPCIEYSRFYDGEDATSEKLRQGLGFSREEAEWYAIELIMDLAVHQLEDMGIVEVTELDDTLVDGEPNYQIELTLEGRQLISEGQALKFRDVLL